MSEMWERGEHPGQAEVHEPIQQEYRSAEFVICDQAGEERDGDTYTALHRAVDVAKMLLDDDPELRELTIWEIDPSGNLLTHHRTVTHGPDANWNTVVVVLKPGEHVRAPGPVPRQITEEDLEGYEPGDPKRQALADRLGEWF